MRHNIKQIISFIFFLTTCITTAVYAEERTIFFKGEKVSQAERGITIMPGENKEGIVISNLPFHYALVLPYSEEWKFTEDDRGILKGHAGPVNLTLKIYKSELSASEVLSKLKEWFVSQSNVLAIDSTEMIRYREQDVLRTKNDIEKIDKTFKGAKMFNYYTVKKWKNIAYEYHLSRIFRPEALDRFNEKEFFEFVTKGFYVDFMR